MPVYNALPHLDEAVESILDQTFGDFEFVILDDASSDGSTERLRAWAKRDRRIRLLEMKQNLGPVGSSNMVARAAKAPFVARMDADDISCPDRLEEELRLLREHPDAGVVASVCDMIDVAGNKMRGPDLWRLSRHSVFVPFAHGAMLYRRSIFNKVGGYREACEYWEDQDLVVRMASVSKIIVIPHPLYRVRQSTTSTRVLCDQDRLERALDRAYQATDRLQNGLDSDEVLEARDSVDGKLDPRVFIAIGSVRLWAGGKPRLFRRMLSRARLSWNMRSATALIWTAWASASPSSLRRFLLLLLRARNRLALQRQRLNDDPVFWQPREGAKELRRTEREQ
jgi:glycosyltransferase involved in cell wall biosynthesis